MFGTLCLNKIFSKLKPTVRSDHSLSRGTQINWHIQFQFRHIGYKQTHRERWSSPVKVNVCQIANEDCILSHSIIKIYSNPCWTLYSELMTQCQGMCAVSEHIAASVCELFVSVAALHRNLFVSCLLWAVLKRSSVFNLLRVLRLYLFVFMPLM